MCTVTVEDIEEALIETIQSHADLEDIKLAQPITRSTRPYPDLGLNSNDDVNLACEVEAVLGVLFPVNMTFLYTGSAEPVRALTIAGAAARMVKALERRGAHD